MIDVITGLLVESLIPLILIVAVVAFFSRAIRIVPQAKRRCGGAAWSLQSHTGGGLEPDHPLHRQAAAPD